MATPLSRVDAATGMDAVELRRASCVDYITALLKGSGRFGMSVTGGGGVVRVASQDHAHPALVARDLGRRVPVMWQYEDGGLAVLTHFWAVIHEGAEKVRVMAHEGDQVQVVSLARGDVHLIHQDRLSASHARTSS